MPNSVITSLLSHLSKITFLTAFCDNFPLSYTSFRLSNVSNKIIIISNKSRK